MSELVVGKLRPIKDHVIVNEMKFDRPISKGGIILPRDDGKSEGVRPRWAKVYAVGPEQTDISVGQWILIAHGRWTRGVEVRESEDSETLTLRRADVDDILAVRDEAPEDCDR